MSGKLPVWHDFSREELLAFIDSLVKEVLIFYMQRAERCALQVRWEHAEAAAKRAQEDGYAAFRRYFDHQSSISYRAYQDAIARTRRAEKRATLAFERLHAHYDNNARGRS